MAYALQEQPPALVVDGSRPFPLEPRELALLKYLDTDGRRGEYFSSTILTPAMKNLGHAYSQVYWATLIRNLVATLKQAGFGWLKSKQGTGTRWNPPIERASISRSLPARSSKGNGATTRPQGNEMRPTLTVIRERWSLIPGVDFTQLGPEDFKGYEKRT